MGSHINWFDPSDANRMAALSQNWADQNLNRNLEQQRLAMDKSYRTINYPAPAGGGPPPSAFGKCTPCCSFFVTLFCTISVGSAILGAYMSDDNTISTSLYVSAGIEGAISCLVAAVYCATKK